MIDWLDEDGKWAGLRSVAMVLRPPARSDGRVSLERRYYVNSLPADPKRINEAVRAHWAIENSMHWVLDVAFGEDQCRVRVDNAAQNAILRRIVSNLLRADKATKVGIKNKQLKAGFDEHYRARVGLECRSLRCDCPAEGDFIMGAGNQSSVGVLVERTSRLVLLAKMEDATAASALAGFTAKLNSIAAPLRQSFTYDQV